MDNIWRVEPKLPEFIPECSEDVIRGSVVLNDGPDKKESILRARLGEIEVPVVNPVQVAKEPRRLWIIDSGASTGVINDSLARETWKKFIRDTKEEMVFDTANHAVSTSKGLRVRLANWDMPSDYVIMKGSPELVSMGEKCMFQGFSYLWVAGKHPCFISWGADISSYSR